MGIVSGSKNHAGVRCENCQNMWTDSSLQIMKRVNNWGKKLTDTTKCLNVALLSASDAVSMGIFLAAQRNICLLKMA